MEQKLDKIEKDLQNIEQSIGYQKSWGKPKNGDQKMAPDGSNLNVFNFFFRINEIFTRGKFLYKYLTTFVY